MKIEFVSLAFATGAAAIGSLVLIPAGPLEETSMPAAQGIVAVLDEQNGGFRAPTAQEAAKFQPPVATTASRATVVRRADGSESMRVDDRYLSFSTATLNDNGRVAHKCGPDHDHATHSTALTAKAVK